MNYRPRPLLALLAAALGGAVTLPALASSCDALEPFKLRYEVERGDTRLGTGEVRLASAGVESCYRLQQTATPHFLLRWLSGPAEQNSEFCRLPDGRLRAYGYSQHRTGVGAEKENYALEFDWSEQVVRGGRFGETEITPEHADTLMLQIRVRRWLCELESQARLDAAEPIELPYVDHRGTGSYTFAITGPESVETPAGRFDTLLVERIDADDREAKFWLEPGRNYRLVKAEQRKDDDPVIRLSLLPED